MLPCCRNALCCRVCLSRWLADSSVCPHCREEVQLENCLPQPLIRPIIDMLRDWSSLVKCTKTVLHYIAYLLTQSFIHDLSFTIDDRWFWLPTPRSKIHYPNIETENWNNDVLLCFILQLCNYYDSDWIDDNVMIIILVHYIISLKHAIMMCASWILI